MATLIGQGFIEIVPRLTGSFAGQVEGQLVGATRTAGTRAAAEAQAAGTRSGTGFVEGMRGTLGSLAPMIKGMAAMAGIAGIASFAKASVDAFKEVAGGAVTLQRVMGGSITQASEWNAVASRFGISTQQMSVAMKTLSKDMVSGKGPLVELGIATKDVHGQMLPMGTVLMSVADKFKAMPDGAEKSRLAVELFGKSGLALLPILNKGSAGIQELMDAAKRMGIVLDQSAIDKYKKMVVAQKDLSEATQGLKVALGEALTPVMTALALFITNNVVPAFRSLVDFVSRLIPVLEAHLAPIVERLGPMFRNVVEAMVAVGTTIAHILQPVIGLGLALAGLFAQGLITTINGVATAFKEVAGWLDRNRAVVALLAGAWLVLNREMMTNIAAGAILSMYNGLSSLRTMFTNVGTAASGLIANIRNLGGGSLAVGVAAFSALTLAATAVIAALDGMARAGSNADAMMKQIETRNPVGLNDQAGLMARLGDLTKSQADNTARLGSVWHNFVGEFTGSTYTALAAQDKFTAAQSQALFQLNGLRLSSAVLAHQYGLTTEQVQALATAHGVNLAQGVDQAMADFNKMAEALRAGAPASSNLKNQILSLADQTKAAKDAAAAFSDELNILFGRFLGYDDAAIATATAIQKIAQAAKDSKGSIAAMRDGVIQGSAAQITLRDSLNKSLSAIQAQGAAFVTMGKSPAEAAALVSKLTDQLYKNALASGVNKKDLDAWMASMHLIPPATGAAAAALKQAEDAAGRLGAAFRQVGPSTDAAAAALKKAEEAAGRLGDAFGKVGPTVHNSINQMNTSVTSLNGVMLAMATNSEAATNRVILAMGRQSSSSVQLASTTTAQTASINGVMLAMATNAEGSTNRTIAALGRQGASSIQLASTTTAQTASINGVMLAMATNAEGTTNRAIAAMSRQDAGAILLASTTTTQTASVNGSMLAMATNAEGTTNRAIAAMGRQDAGAILLASTTTAQTNSVNGSMLTMASNSEATTNRAIAAMGRQDSGVILLAGTTTTQTGSINGAMLAMASTTEGASNRAILALDRMQSSITGLHGNTNIPVTATANVHFDAATIALASSVGITIGGSQAAQLAADGGIRKAADGDVYLPSRAMIAPPQPGGGFVQWAEPETGGEAFIPLAPQKRQRSVEIWRKTGQLLGQFAFGGINLDIKNIDTGPWMTGIDQFRTGSEGIAKAIGQKMSNAEAPKIASAFEKLVISAIESRVAAASLGSAGGVADSNAVVAFAKTLIGCRYGPPYYDPSGFSCDGLVWYVFKHFGIELPRGATNQMNGVQRLGGAGDAQPGDVVGFHQDGPSAGNPLGLEFHHIGLVSGVNQMIDALGTAYGVRVDNIASVSNGPGAYVKYGRVLQNLNPGWGTPAYIAAHSGSSGGGHFSQIQIYAALQAAGANATVAHILSAIAMHENPNSTRYTNSTGTYDSVFALQEAWTIPLGLDINRLNTDIDYAAQQAYALYLRSGNSFSPWEAYTNGSYAASMAKGGLVQSYDRGGFLPPGLSVAYNGTGKPEPVGHASTVQNNSVTLTLNVANGDPVTMRAAAQQVVDDALTALARRLSSGAGRN